MEIPANQSFVHVEQLELRAGGTGRGKSSGGLSEFPSSVRTRGFTAVS